MLRKLHARMRSLWRGLRRRSTLEAEMSEEFMNHLALRTEDLVRRGLSHDAARRQAQLEFGHVETHKDAARASRGLRRLDEIRLSWLDLKLGGRMLVRYPGLTLVAGLAMAFAIAVGTSTFEVLTVALNPTLPLPGGGRIIGITYWDRERNAQELPTSSDVQTWRDQLRSVEWVGAFRLVQRNLSTDGGAGEPIDVSEISASAFRLFQVRPELGRTLTDADEDPGAPAVVLLGHRLWKRRFHGDSTVVGRVVRLGQSQVTVVGVMPDGFVFPVNHDIWTPLRMAVAEPGTGSHVRSFGRLRSGITLAAAQSELTALTQRSASEYPKRYAHLAAQALPYAQSIIWISPDVLARAGLYSINGFGALLLLLVCGNVALLMFARVATREKEILVRSALGASRARIITQLFAEALVLGSLAGLLGLVAARFGLQAVDNMLSTGSDEPWPFWFRAHISGATVLYAGLLTLVGVTTAGVVPALKITARGLATRLRQTSAGAGGPSMGGIWTVMIVAQIAATVVFTAAAWVVLRQSQAIASVKTAFPPDEYLAVRVDMNRERSAADAMAPVIDSARYTALVEELERRVSAHASVVDVTVAAHVPLMPHSLASIELEGPGAAGSSGGRRTAVATSAVAPDFFRVFKAPIVFGRDFGPGDTHAGANTVVVNQLFAVRVFAGQNPIGRRIRYVRPNSTDPRTPANATEPWLEIVGVVRDMVQDVRSPLNLDSPTRPELYYPLGRGATDGPLYLAVHARGRAVALIPALRTLATDVSAELRLSNIQSLDQASSGDARAWKLLARVVLLASAITLLLSLAGIYSVMSFTVSRRTREIGVRVALGANASRVIFEIFRKPLSHVAAGLTAGLLVVSALVLASARTFTAHTFVVLLTYAITMLAVCVIACAGPARRALRVQPTEALSADV
jgi:putative ABC transport system permease protein